MLAGVSRRRPDKKPIVRRQSSTSSVRSSRRDDPLPRERVALDFYSPIYSDPVWVLSPGGTTQCLLCDDSGGFDIETSPSVTSNYVVGTASGRVWVYGRNKRVKFQQNSPNNLQVAIFNRLNTSQHEKRLLHDPSPSPPPLLAGSTSPSAKSAVLRHEQRSIRRRWPTLTRSCAQNPRLQPFSPPASENRGGDLYYLGQVVRGRRNGWGRLMSNQRTLYEGGWFEGGCHGYYLAFHEFYAEIGLQCPWFRVGVLVLRDNGNSIVPIALDRQPSIFKGDRSADIVLQKSEYVNEREPFYSRKDDWWRCGEPPVFESAYSTKSFDLNKGYSSRGGAHDTISLSQSDRESSVVSTARRGSGPELERRSQGTSDTSLFLRPKEERRRSSITQQKWSGSESSMARSRCFLAHERKMHRRLSNPSDARARICPATQTLLAEPSAKTVRDKECLSLWRHRRLMADFHRYGVIKASSLSRWSTEQLLMFLAAIGAYEAIGPFKRARLDGSQVQTLDLEILERIGISDVNCRKMLLSTFRYLWSGLDYTDPLAARDLRAAHSIVNPIPDLNSHHLQIRRRIGNGGHAMVYLGSIEPGPLPPFIKVDRAALKIFTDTRKPRSVRIPSSNRPNSAPSFCLQVPPEPTTKTTTPSLEVTPTTPSDGNRSDAIASSDAVASSEDANPSEAVSDSEAMITPVELKLSSQSPEHGGFFGSDVWRGCGGTGGLMAMSMISFSTVISSIKDWLGPPPAPPPAIKIDIIKGEVNNTPPLPEEYSEERLPPSNKKTAASKMRDYEIAVMQCIPKHPHVIQALGHFRLPGELPGIAIEFCSRGALDNQILYEQQRSPLASGSRCRYSWGQLVQIFKQIAEGMAHVHESGFLHRDLKPSNFLIDEGHVGKVSDFGVSKSYKLGNPKPFFLAAYGNIYYAAPEVLRGEGSWPESDVYSFGVSFWEALTGKAVHEGLSRGHIFCRVATGKVAFPPPPLLSTGLSLLLSKMVAFDRQDRPSFRQIACYISQLDQANSVDALTSVQALVLG